MRTETTTQIILSFHLELNVSYKHFAEVEV